MLVRSVRRNYSSTLWKKLKKLLSKFTRHKKWFFGIKLLSEFFIEARVPTKYFFRHRLKIFLDFLKCNNYFVWNSFGTLMSILIFHSELAKNLRVQRSRLLQLFNWKCAGFVQSFDWRNWGGWGSGFHWSNDNWPHQNSSGWGTGQCERQLVKSQSYGILESEGDREPGQQQRLWLGDHNQAS